ncbi:MAG: DinB family protein [Candidatus Thorarchaeota archaeon]
MRQMVEIIAFNAWANERFRQTLRDIPLEKLQIETPYGSLLERIVHVFASIDMWMDRMEGKSPIKVKSAKDFKEWKEIQNSWEKADQRLLNYVKSLKNDTDFDKKINYISLKNDHFESIISNILIHLSHHQMYHRGQIAIVLR